MKRTQALLLAASAVLLALTPRPAAAQSARAPAAAPAAAPAPAPRAGPAVMEALALSGAEPTIDGRLEDAAWAAAPVAGDFVQFEPSEGQAATERT